ncbi:hypothetical protein JTE90_002987 [Oedothorax gibbosus]|uniref:Uncharacterized protein n=1 Tax=Oedothorax gibbosus TaxID=931172 RepID=A0AAV6VHV5_9ARAC|nr:hypothetical protein JTE90_002987 [Oedothorax gibbosus]
MFQAFECIGCSFDSKIFNKYKKCHGLLPTRILISGQNCIKKITKTSNIIEQWMDICSDRNKFLEVFLCTNGPRGSPKNNPFLK